LTIIFFASKLALSQRSEKEISSSYSFDTHATILIESGADVKDVQTRLGHANIQTTLQTYVHDTEAMANRSVDIFEQAIEQKKLS